MHVFVDESMNAISSNLVEKRSGKPSLIVPLFQYSGVWCLFDLKKSPLLKGLISRFPNHACSYIKAYIFDASNPFVSNCKQWLSPVAWKCWLTNACFASVLDDVWLKTTITTY